MFENELRRIIREEVRAAIRAERPTSEPSSDERVYVSVPEAARIAGVHDQTIRKWIRDGLLGEYRAGARQLRVKLHELETYLGRKGAPAPTIDIKARALELLKRTA